MALFAKVNKCYITIYHSPRESKNLSACFPVVCPGSHPAGGSSNAVHLRGPARGVRTASAASVPSARLWYWVDALGIAARYAWVRMRLSSRRAIRPAVQREDKKGMGSFMDRMGMNLQYAVRRLLKAPLFTLVAIVSLGLGIGANTAIFNLVNAVILRPVPFEDPASLVDVYASALGYSAIPLSFLDEEDVARNSSEVSDAVGGSALIRAHASPRWGRNGRGYHLLPPGSEQLPLILDMESTLGQVKVPVQIDDGPADVTVG